MISGNSGNRIIRDGEIPVQSARSNKFVKSKKLAYLEGVRGMAAVLVVIHHYLLAFYPAQASGNLNHVHVDKLELWYYQSPFLFLTNGQLFVYIFFILSGHVLSKRFFKEKEISYLASAFIRRLPRLYIPVAFSLIFAFILLKLSLNFNLEASRVTKSIWLSVLEGNPSCIVFLKILFLQSMFLGDSSYNTVLWSISIELYGSLLVFATLALIYKSKNSFFILALIFLILLIHQKFGYCAFILGIMLNYSEGFNFKSFFFKRITVIVLILFGLFLGGFPHIYYLSTPTIKGTFYDFLNYSFIIKRDGLINAIGAFCLILAIQQSSKLQSVFSGRILVFLGAISFSIYLLHAVILLSFSSYLFIILHELFSYNISFLLDFIASIILIGLIGYTMTFYVDNKSVTISKSIYNRYFLKKEKSLLGSTKITR